MAELDLQPVEELDIQPVGEGGVVEPGNIDLTNRPVIKNADGTISTERSFSIGTDKGEVLIPEIVNGKLVTKQEAIQHYRDTGEHLGIFSDVQSANTAAKAIHNRGQLDLKPVATEAAPSWLQRTFGGAHIASPEEYRQSLAQNIPTAEDIGKVSTEPIGGGLPILAHPPDESALGGIARGAYNVPAGYVNAAISPAGLATVGSFALGQPEIGAALIAAQLAPHAGGLIEHNIKAATGQLPPGQSFETALTDIALVAPMAHEAAVPALREAEATLAKPILKVAGVSSEDIAAYQKHLRSAKEFQPITSAVAPPEGYEVSKKGVTEPPDVPAEFLAKPAAAEPVAEPVKTSVTADLTRQLVDARKGLLAEAQDLQTQADISKAATGTVHPAVAQRIAAINEELARPTVGVPVDANAPATVLQPNVTTAKLLDASTLRWKGNPLGLRPAYQKANGEIVIGELNQVHADLPGISQMQGQRTDTGASIGYVTPEGKYLNREQAYEAIQAAKVTPSEAAQAVAVSPASTTPGDVAAGQQPAQPAGTVSVGAGSQGAVGGAGRGTPTYGGISKRTVAEDIQLGILPADALVIGKGWDATKAAARGRYLINEGVDPQHVVDAIAGRRAMPRIKGKPLDAGDAVAAIHAERDRFAAERADAHRKYGLTSPQAKLAENAEAQWLRQSRPAAGGLAQRAITAFQDASPVDIGTFDGLYKKAADVAADNGRTVSDGQKIEMARRTRKTEVARDAVTDSVTKRQKVLDRELPKVKTPNDAEMQNLVEDMVKELTPCK